ncbi:MAG: sulfatase-like hydrolase/transferase [Myxococcaceae bacterium]|nr:sulfatase-like hydrolase/transferase [Myxococcaceae bacterium]
MSRVAAPDTFRFRLTVLTVLFFLGWKLWALPKQPTAMLVGTWLFEACALAWVFTLCAALDRVRVVARLRLPSALFAAGYLLLYVLGFFTVFFFDDQLVRKYSLLDMGPDAVAYLLHEVAPKRGVVQCAVTLAVLCLAAWVSTRWRPRVPSAALLAVLGVASVGAVTVASSSAKFPTPLWDLALDLDEVRRHPGIAKPSGERPRHPPSLLDRASHEAVRFESRYSRVIVLVMEGVTQSHFDATAREGDAFRRTVPQQHVYSRYFTNDMDSRTGMLATLTSRFVPYEAYQESNHVRFSKLSGMRSLVDVMRENGYHTVLASAQVLAERVVRDLSWHENVVFTEDETDALEKTYLCFNPYRFEDSCEDRAMLPRLFDRLKQHDKLFWVQQLVWGHQPEFTRKSGKSDVQSYAELLDELLAELERAGQLETTLIVVTSDHGIRQRGTEALMSSYHIPLFFYSPGLARIERPELHSQIDFKDLLLAELTGAEPPAEAPFALFVGPTYSSTFGAVTKTGDFMLVKDRPLARYVLAHENAGGPPKGAETPYELLRLFDDYREYFESPGFR